MTVVDRETFTVVRLGRSVRILDSSGRAVAKVQSDVACAMTERAESDLRVLLLWRPKLQQMACHFFQRVDRCVQNPWEKKCGVWMRSLRWRRNRTKHVRKTNSLSSNRRQSDLTWDDASRLLLAQYANRFYEKRKREESPWRLWAQTVYSNLKKRRDIRNERAAGHQIIEAGRESDDQGIDGGCRKTRLQMCFDWH